jgi:hypothetical protein
MATASDQPQSTQSTRRKSFFLKNLGVLGVLGG